MKLYVLVRNDISPSQSAVQAGHAVAEYLLHDSITWRNTTLIYLGIKSLFQLEKWMDKLEGLGVKYIPWKEPDINNEVTAIATTGSDELFKKLNLL
jgi:hypothetical protein